jgi:hypothetical protein
VIVDLFDHFDDRLYSPKLYESLGEAVKELHEASRLIAQPMHEIIIALERIHLRIVVEDPSWRELYKAFQSVSTELLLSSSTITKSRHVARHVTREVAMTAFNALIEYLIPRLLLLINVNHSFLSLFLQIKRNQSFILIKLISYERVGDPFTKDRICLPHD